MAITIIINNQLHNINIIKFIDFINKFKINEKNNFKTNFLKIAKDKKHV